MAWASTSGPSAKARSSWARHGHSQGSLPVAVETLRKCDQPLDSIRYIKIDAAIDSDIMHSSYYRRSKKEKMNHDAPAATAVNGTAIQSFPPAQQKSHVRDQPACGAACHAIPTSQAALKHSPRDSRIVKIICLYVHKAEHKWEIRMVVGRWTIRTIAAKSD